MPENFDTIIDVIDRSRAAAAVIGAPVSGTSRRSLPLAIARIPRMPDLVNGGTFYKADGSPVMITPISGETTAIRLLVAATGPMRTALVLTFSGAVTINWGDGSTSSPISGTAAVHQYDNVNPIPVNRSYGVYLITITGGAVTAIASSAATADWGAMVGNLIAIAIKSANVTTLNYLLRSSGGSTVVSSFLEKIYYDVPAVTSGTYLLNGSAAIASFFIKTSGSLTNPLGGLTAPHLEKLDFSQTKISGDFNASSYFPGLKILLFSTSSTALGNISIQNCYSLSAAALEAMIYSLPTVTSKVLALGSHPAALAVSSLAIAEANARGWTVTQS